MQAQSRICLVSHAEDLDGLASAALLARKFGVGKESIYFADYSPQLLSFVFKKLRSRNCKAVFVTDLSVNESKAKDWLKILSSLRRKHTRIFWLDHHPWPENAEAVAKLCDIAEYGENARYCATEIVANTLSIKDAYAKKLAKLVHMSDFAIKPKSRKDKMLLKAYDLAIAYANSMSIERKESLLASMSMEISRGKLENERINKIASLFEKVSKKEIAKSLRRIYTVANVAVAFSSSKALFDELLEKLFEKSGKEVVIAVNVDRGKASIRSKKRDISGLAIAMHGGGHPHAAGFPVSGKYKLSSESGRMLFLKMLEKKIRKSLC